MKEKQMLAMLLAGGQGSRLGALTQHLAKPAVAFGGKYRIVDFSLSNCANSHIDTVGVLTQYKPLLLNAYIGTGMAWDLDNREGGVYILPPYVSENGGNWYNGTADAVYQNMDFIKGYHPNYVLIISGDHIYEMDYHQMLEFHMEKNADVTISSMSVPIEEASRFGVIVADENKKITEFQEKPQKPKSNLASMGIYIFNWDVLQKALEEDEENKGSDHDFGKNILPKLLDDGKGLYSYDFTGYWRDVGTIESYYEANMELLQENPPFHIFEAKIYSNNDILPPHYLGINAGIANSLVANGSTIFGNVKNCIIGSEVLIEVGAQVENSIILAGAKICSNAVVHKTIVGERAVISEDCVVGIPTTNPPQGGISVVEDDYVLTAGSRIKMGENVGFRFRQEGK